MNRSNRSYPASRRRLALALGMAPGRPYTTRELATMARCSVQTIWGDLDRWFKDGVISRTPRGAQKETFWMIAP